MSRSSLLFLLAFVGLHATLVLFVRWYVRSSMLTPVVLGVPDLLVGDDEPLTAFAALFDARTGEPQADAQLDFSLHGETALGAALSASTDATGHATVTWERVSAQNPTGVTGEAHLAVSLHSPSRWLLAGGEAVPTVGPRRALALVLYLPPQTNILLVALESLADGAVAVSTTGLETLAEESRLQERTVYVVVASEWLRSRVRLHLEMAGLHEGPLIILDPSSYASALGALRDRLRSLEVNVNTILCDGGRDRELEYEGAFPGARVMALGGQRAR